jgi:quercetin dioxygenase-like cupin family protein
VTISSRPLDTLWLFEDKAHQDIQIAPSPSEKVDIFDPSDTFKGENMIATNATPTLSASHRNRIIEQISVVPSARNTAVENSIWYMGSLMTILADGQQTGGQFALIEITGVAGTEPPRHIHEYEDETFYIMEGEVTFYVGDEVIEATPGTAVFMPKRIPHSFKLKTDRARALLLVSPAGFENWFREFAEPAAALTLPPPAAPSLEVYEKMIAAGARYGIEFLPS